MSHHAENKALIDQTVLAYVDSAAPLPSSEGTDSPPQFVQVISHLHERQCDLIGLQMTQQKDDETDFAHAFLCPFQRVRPILSVRQIPRRVVSFASLLSHYYRFVNLQIWGIAN